MTDLPIVSPGIYPDIDPDDYHADPVEGGSLSSSGARALLPPGCPARYHWDRHNPPAPKRHFDIGHGVHTVVLGTGPKLVCIEHDSYRTKAAQVERDDAHEDGHVPLLRHEYEAVHDMADAIRRHPFAGKLFEHGRSEVTLVWQDDRTGIMRRCRLDYLPDGRAARIILGDLKSAMSVEPEALTRAMGQHGFHQQADWNRAGCQALDVAGPDAQFVFVAVEKEPPYLITVYQPDHEAMRIGATQNRIAIDVYKRCVETDHWPDYADGEVLQLPLPAWIERQWSDT